MRLADANRFFRPLAEKREAETFRLWGRMYDASRSRGASMPPPPVCTCVPYLFSWRMI
jgi:hypothetical protein